MGSEFVEVAKVNNIEHLFDQQATRSPGATAVVCGNQRITYGELNLRSNQLAHYLKRIGVKAESLVGVYLERSVEMVVALLGILKSGGAYVPLDPQYPSERVEYIVTDSGLKAVLTQARLVPSLPQLDGVQMLCLDHEWEQVAQEPDDRPELWVDGDNLAHVIYTSGSTGRPKGVGIRRRSTAILSHWAAGIFGDDLMGVLASTSICFDLSVFEILVPLTVGGTVFVVNNALGLPGISCTEDLRLVNTVPSVISELLRQSSLPASVRTVNLAGEALRQNLVDQIYEEHHVNRLFNLYGPTEDTTYSTYVCLNRGATNGVVPIGTGITQTQVYILDDQLREVAVGNSGELYLGGDGLARGYINQPALTAARFLPNPFSSEWGARMYRTSDQVRCLPDGNLEFLGRLDEQVKVRGFRIELGEIETVLTQHPNVREAVVVVREDAPGTKRLVAYAAARKTPAPTISELRSHLAAKLPAYMLPAQFVFMEELPRTQTGKLSRRGLPPPEVIAADVIPQTEMEQALVTSCAEVLEVSVVPLDSSFLELGGSSLNATRLIAALQKAFSCDLPIREILGGRTLREVAAEFDKCRTSPSMPQATFGKASRNRPLPASFSQERVWFVQRVDPSSLAYCFTAQIIFRGDLDVAALEKALNRIVERHEIFRTTLTETEGRLFQVIHNPWKVELNCLDLRGRAADVQRLLQKESRQPFDLAALPLVRWRLVQLEDKKYLFQSVEHHMVHDGWSYYVFLNELTELYQSFTEGTVPRLHPSPLQFADFTQWQRDWIETPPAQQQMEHWSRTLAGVPPLLSLPYDRPRPEVQTHKGDCLRIDLSDDLYQNLLAAARHNQVTSFMLCIAAFQILLFRYSAQDDFCIGTGIANRRWRETGTLIGMLVNNIALRVHTDARSTIAKVVDDVRETALAAYANQDLPFDKVVQVVQPVRDLSYNPLFQVMWSFHDSPVACPKLTSVTMEIEQALSNGSSKFDMNIVVISPQSHNLPSGHRAHAKILWEYNTDLFDAETIQRMITHYLRILETVVKSPQTLLKDIALLTDSECRQMVMDWNSSKRPYPQEQLNTIADDRTAAAPGEGTQRQLLQEVVHGLFEKQAARTPKAVAVTYDDQQFTYAELNRRANRLAHYLRKLDAGLEAKVGICLERSPEAVVACLAVLKAGHAYVPLDPAFPSERLAFMLADAEVSILVTQERCSARLPKTSGSILYLDKLADVLEAEPDSNLGIKVRPDNLAYVMYTSGSTGEPKGAAIPHKAIVRLLFGVDYVQLGPDETLLQLAPLGFDASTFELWGALLHGGRLVIYPDADLDLERLEAVLQKNNVTCIWLTASLFNLVIDSNPKMLRGVRQILTGGEALSIPHIDRALELLPGAILINGYGPTEGTTFTCCFILPRPRPAHWGSIPIGNPIGDTQVFILDAFGLPAPIGVTGELYVGGAGLARGYLNRPELTAEMFVPNPFSTIVGERLYRTGDLVRWRSDRTIEFLGRRDDQIKIRGHRIELGEIERTLQKHVAIREAVVVPRPDASGEKQLVAYLVDQPGLELDVDELLMFIEQKLPEYMIPASFVLMEALPLRPSGKVDTKALPAPDFSARDRDYMGPRTSTEKRLAAIWADMLTVEKVGTESHFFRLGGHSLKVIQMIARVRDTFGVDLTIRDIFENPTLAALSRAIKRAEEQQNDAIRRPAIVACPRDGELPLSFNEEILWSAAQLRPHYLAFNTQLGARLLGEMDMDALQKSFDEIMRRHEALRTTFPIREGRPYRAIAPPVNLQISTVDLTPFAEDERAQKSWDLALEDAKSPFNLAAGPLLRVKLLRLAPQQNILLITAHHIITDGWSLGLLSRELQALYGAYSQGRPLNLSPLEIQYADYAKWQRTWLKGEVFQQLLGYWIERLRGVKGLQRLPADLSESSDAEIRQDVVSFTLDKQSSDGLRQLSDREGVTLFMTLLAVYKLLLHCATAAEDVVVAVPVSERSHSELESVMGLFVNLVALHTDFRGNPRFVDLLHQLLGTSQDAYAHQDVPFVIVEQALGHAEMSRTMFDFINLPDFDIDLPGLDAEPFSAKGTNPFKMDVILFVRDRDSGIHISVMYNANLFSRARIVDLVKQFEYLVEQILQAPERKVDDCSLDRSAHTAKVAI